jgi:maleate isomerase
VRAFADILPPTNVAVEAEYAQMLADPHQRRKDTNLDSDARFDQFRPDLRKEIVNAVRGIMTAELDYMVMDMSSETFWCGKTGAALFQTLLGDCKEDWTSPLTRKPAVQP